MRNIMKILTPENVYIDFELACVGSRFAAVLIDHLIQILLLVIINLSIFSIGIGELLETEYSNLQTMYTVISIITVFLITFFYFVISEIFFNGQTIGKKLFKLKVIKETGEPIGIIESLIRNLIRILHLILPLYFVDGLFILFTKKYKRIGDYAANTIVVKVENIKNAVKIEDMELIIKKNKVLNSKYQITQEEYELLEEFISREYSIGNKKYEIGILLKKYFVNKFKLDESGLNTFDFLNEVYKTALVK